MPITRNQKVNHESKGAVMLKQAHVLQNMVENGGKSGGRGGISQAARAAGYSEAYIKSGKLQKTKAWNDLIKDSFPDEELATLHRQQLYAQTIKQIPFFYKVKDKEIKDIIEGQGFTFISTKRFMRAAYVYFSMPDTMTRDKALDKVYKLKNRYNNTLVVQRQFEKRSLEEIDQDIAEIIAEAMEVLSK